MKTVDSYFPLCELFHAWKLLQRHFNFTCLWQCYKLLVFAECMYLFHASIYSSLTGFCEAPNTVLQKPAKVVLSSMEVVAQSMGFKTHIRNYKMRVEGLSANKTSHFSVILEIFEVAPTFFMVDIQKAAGDVADYLKFYKNFVSNLEDIIWKPPNESSKSRISKNRSKRR
ncbi:CBL-interacting serine/threonine-protein kinase 8-like isoform X1 [Ziziphus jujuba]|uniref:CBL-interacting serine/threonine-protein kinase 8-like isoform X1 n=1 Tax=Ziziphus jujuba TaxID=326968 RepID=A0ABM3ZT25_ZIZJJ|nr:CBL-interacting serine/threonine-protein kinase 8-like isoform X1 [Ziziphus jujuba]